MKRVTTLTVILAVLCFLIAIPAAMAQQSSQQQNYLKAKADCLEGKGYSVK